MIVYKNECIGCPTEIGCIGDTCPYRNVKRLYCDECENEDDVLYEFYDEQLCKHCVLDKLYKITI